MWDLYYRDEVENFVLSFELKWIEVFFLNISLTSSQRLMFGARRRRVSAGKRNVGWVRSFDIFIQTQKQFFFSAALSCAISSVNNVTTRSRERCKRRKSGWKKVLKSFSPLVLIRTLSRTSRKLEKKCCIQSPSEIELDKAYFAWWSVKVVLGCAKNSMILCEILPKKKSYVKLLSCEWLDFPSDKSLHRNCYKRVSVQDVTSP